MAQQPQQLPPVNSEHPPLREGHSSVLVDPRGDTQALSFIGDDQQRRESTDSGGGDSSAEAAMAAVSERRKLAARLNLIADFSKCVDQDGKVIEHLFETSLMRFDDDDLEDAFRVYEMLTSPYRMAMFCGVCCIGTAAGIGDSAGRSDTRPVVIYISVIVTITLLLLFLAEIVAAWKFSRAASRKDILMLTSVRETISVTAFLSLGLLVAFNTYAFIKTCGFLGDRRDNYRCEYVYPFIGFVASTAAVWGRPRAVLIIPVLLLLPVVMTITRRFWSLDSVDQYGYKMGITCIIVIAGCIAKAASETSMRHAFRQIAVSEGSRILVIKRRKQLISYVETIIPSEIKTRLSRAGSLGAVDICAQAGCIVIAVDKADLFSTSQVPTKSAIAMSTLSTICQQNARRRGLQHIRSVGDVTYTTCNLLVDATDTATESVTYALSVLQTADIAVRIGVHIGQLSGALVGSSFIRYDIHGPALKGALALVLHGEARAVAASDVVVGSLLGSLTTTMPSSSNEVELSEDEKTHVHLFQKQPVPSVHEILEMSSTADSRSAGEAGESAAGVSIGINDIDDDGDGRSSSVHTVTRLRVTLAKMEFDGEPEEKEPTLLLTEGIRVPLSRIANPKENQSCLSTFRRFDDEAIEITYQKSRSLSRRGGLITSLLMSAALAVAIGVSALDEHDYAPSAPQIVGVLILAITLLVAFVAGVQVLQNEFKTLSATVAGIIHCIAGVALIVGAGLTAPSVVGNDTIYIFAAAAHFLMFTPLNTSKLFGVELLLILAHYLMLTVYEPFFLLMNRYMPVILSFSGTYLVADRDIRERESFKHFLESRVALEEVRVDEGYREAILRATIPINLIRHVKRTQQAQLEAWSVNELVTVSIRFPLDISKGGKQDEIREKIRRVDSSVGILEEFLQSIESCELQIVKIFSSDVLIAGPIRPRDESIQDEDVHNAAAQSMALVQKLLDAGVEYTAGLAVEQAVVILQHSDYPTFDIYGRSPSAARGLMAECPGLIPIASDKLVSVVKNRCGPEMRAGLNLRFGHQETWRIRGMGVAKVNPILKCEASHPDCVSLSEAVGLIDLAAESTFESSLSNPSQNKSASGSTTNTGTSNSGTSLKYNAKAEPALV